MVKNVQFVLDDTEYERIKKRKGRIPWPEFIIGLIQGPDYEAAKTRALGRLQERGFTHPGEILEIFIEELGKA